jgi:hypothetical protein
MTFDDLVKEVSDECPPFNDFALRGFVKENIDESPHFPAMVLREGFKLVGDQLELVGDPVILSPEETVLHELTSGSSKSAGRAKVPLTVTHMRLVRYNVRFGEHHLPVHLYMPYMFNDMLMIRDKYSMIRKVILEQTFSRVSEKDKDGMSVSPIRVNLTFNRKIVFKIQSYNSGAYYDHFVVTSRLFHGAIANKVCETTLVHYMLAKFGFTKTLLKFGLNQKDIDFTTEVGQDTDAFEYFAARKYDDKVEQGPGLYLRVRKTMLGDDQIKKFVVNLLYTLTAFRIQDIDNVYVDGYIWKIMLGVILFPDPAGPKAHSNAESHLNSVDSFIDPMTCDRLRAFGVMIDDIYDLLVYVFGEIDSFMVNNQVQDLYNSRMDVANGLLVKSYGTRMTKQIYPLAKRSNISLRDVKLALRINSMMFRHSSSARPDEDKDYVAPPEIVSDNYLLAGGLSKIRMGGRAEQRLHPSMVVGESINAFVGKTIGRTGYLNPYVPTDRNGAITHPDYAADIDRIKAALPR